MRADGPTTKTVPINIVGSSIFGRYPKMSSEKTVNLFQSDTFMVPYSGYQIAINASAIGDGIGKHGRAIFTSTKLNAMIVVIDANVYKVNILYDQTNEHVISSSVINIGSLVSAEGQVYITENNVSQVLISDNINLYIYDGTPVQVVPNLNFKPGYISFHDNRFLCAASNDTIDGTKGPFNNTWRLSALDNGLSWPNTASFVGYLQTKPDNTQAIVRFPSKGNMIFVMGSIVTEAWFDTGAQLFPYQRNNQFNIDYGCLSPATVAYMDEIVVWLAQNEKSGPIIMFSEGGMPQQITTDGIDYLFSQLQNPQDSEAFLYRQDGHLFYHINFYSDNLSLYYDFNLKKFYNACDQNFNYFIAGEVAFFDNQYYFITRNNGCIFAFDTIFTTYQSLDALGNVETYIIPRIRICKNISSAKQNNFILNDIGFTIESGETNYQVQPAGPEYIITQNNFFLVTQDNFMLALQEGTGTLNTPPAVDLSLSYDGGASFGNQWRYELPGIGQRKNRLMWWNCGCSNDIVPQFMFWGIGRFVITDGEGHIRE